MRMSSLRQPISWLATLLLAPFAWAAVAVGLKLTQGEWPDLFSFRGASFGFWFYLGTWTVIGLIVNASVKARGQGCPDRNARSHSDVDQRGFAFVKVLVIVGTLASLVGLVLGAHPIASRVTPEAKAPQLVKMRAQLDSWRGAYKATLPSNPRK